MNKKARRSKKEKTRKKPGLPPGSLIFTGERKVEYPFLINMTYDSQSIKEENLEGREMPVPIAEKTNWLDVRGLSDVPLIEMIGRNFGIHPLALEDILNVNQRPKFEEYDNGLFIILQALTTHREEFEIELEQVGIFISGGTVISFQENESDLFQAVRERLNAGRGRIRSNGADYLGYALIDNIVDHYFLVLDRLEEDLEKLEAEIIENPSRTTKSSIHNLRVEVGKLRKMVAPLREAIGQFSRSESEHVSENTRLFVRDLYDHVVQVLDLVDTQRDVINGLYDLYLSEISYRMNSVMQVLTVIATIFIPLTFLAGVYGMNFDYIPELHWRYGYFVFWGVIVVITFGLLAFFRRKKWL